MQFGGISSSSLHLKLPLLVCESRPHSSFQNSTHINGGGGGGEDDNLTCCLPKHVKLITSPSNPFVKHCLKLRQNSSYRHLHASVLVVGSTPIREICLFQKSLQERPTAIDCVLILDKADVSVELEDYGTRIIRVSSTVMRKLSGMQSTESIEAIALMRIPSTFHSADENLNVENFLSWFPSPHRVLVLDGIQDPGNLGTLLRSAMAFGWGGVFLLPGCCDPFNDKALRASRGASFQLPIVSGDWVHLEALKDALQMKILAGHPADNDKQKSVTLLSRMFADSLADTKICLVLGSEGSGLSEKSRQEAELVAIPMTGEFESLNVSVAGGILLYMLQPANHV
ncbi:hypothetical protein DCAR_0103649 [Daucus carota subsp. sativus]|uniref:tRNA/rRNA methyltransferase SpoU type domain-containing protein n=1 Tax=Daucus carota subsp. sativus TaxID=79200 RepID=A0AAF1ALF0_DAUCS|nr:PREDICTED: uncharacterized tRNA/rRNA methyltransferase YsgA [Daucus carota subsp. sativus]WOG84466.1 hypothetical protein DCAR_0103649 [Daucus carota subsp. sativus]